MREFILRTGLPVEAELTHSNLQRVHMSGFPLLIFLFDLEEKDQSLQAKFALKDLNVIYHKLFEQCFTLVSRVKDASAIYTLDKERS